MGTEDLPRLETNEKRELVGALEQAAESAKRALEDTYHWRWLFTALDSAFQATMIAALEHGDGFALMTKEEEAKAIEAANAGRGYMAKELDGFWSLYKKVCGVAGEYMQRSVGSSALAKTDGLDRALRFFHDQRNGFMHFTPKQWCIVLIGVPEHGLEILRAIEFLAWRSGTVRWHESSLEDRARVALETVRECLLTMKDRYAVTAS